MTTTETPPGLLEECDLHEMIGCQVCNGRPAPTGHVNRRVRCEPVVQALLRLKDKFGEAWIDVTMVARLARVTTEQARAAGYMLKEVYGAVEVRPGFLKLDDLTRYRRVVRTIGTNWDWPGEGRRRGL